MMKRFFVTFIAVTLCLTAVLPPPQVFAAPDDPLTPDSADANDKSGEAAEQPSENKDDPEYNAANENDFFVNRCAEDGSVETVNLSGKDNIEKVLNFFMSKGLSLAQASGFVGNMMQESGVEPRKIQGGAIAPDDYIPVNGVGFGLVQWTFSSRQGPLEAKAKTMGNKKVTDIEVQLAYIWDELNAPNGYAHTLRELKATDDPVKAAIVVHGPPKPGYEASADTPEFVERVRGGNAKGIYDKYKDAPPAGSLGTDSGSGATTGVDTSAASLNKAVIAIDPGHSVADINDIEPETGATLSDYPNGAEVNDMWDVANKVKTGLEKKGFKTVMLKNSKDDKVNFADRAKRAKEAGANMAISLHSTSPGSSEVFNQFVDAYRTGPKATKKFANEQTAQKSKQYSEAVAKKRSEKEGGSVPVSRVDFNGRGGAIAPGNIAWVELLSPDVPWVYNEFSRQARGGSVALTEEDKTIYAEGVIDGIVEANPEGKAASEGISCGGSSGGAATGDLAATAKSYAWPEEHPSGFTERKKEYIDAVAKAKAAGLYTGGCEGVDCGAFVTMLIRDSGHDKGYNDNGKGGPTSAQEAWAIKNWQKIGSGAQDPAKLKPGDVAINDHHTFIFVGDGVFQGTNIASASQCDRAPMAGGDTASEGGFNWYRKK